MIEIKYIPSRTKFGIFENSKFIKFVERNYMNKANFISAIINSTTTLAQRFDQAPDLEAIYFDRGYNSGQANEITQEDLDPYGVTLTAFTDGITLGQQVNKLAQNQVVTQGDYSAIANKLRNDI